MEIIVWLALIIFFVVLEIATVGLDVYKRQEKNREMLKEIEKKRKELGLSQVELAKRIGFSRGYYNMLIHGKKPVSDKLADQLQNVLQEYRKEKESGYGMQTENLEEGFKSADDVWNIKEAGEMTDEYIEENEDSIRCV